MNLEWCCHGNYAREQAFKTWELVDKFEQQANYSRMSHKPFLR